MVLPNSWMVYFMENPIKMDDYTWKLLYWFLGKL